MTAAPRWARTAGTGLLAGVLAGSLAGCGFFGGESEPEIAANVAGTVITSDRVNELFQRFASTEAGAAMMVDRGDGIVVSKEQVKANVLSLEVKLTFLEVLAEREGIVVPEAAPASEDLFQDFAEINTLAAAGYRAEDLATAHRAEAIGKAIAAKLLPEVSISDAELETTYEQRKQLFEESFRAKTGVAFMDDLDAANRLRRALADGKDFDSAIAAVQANVIEESTIEVNPLTTPIPRNFIDAVEELQAGQTSEPFEYDIGGRSVIVVLHQVERKDLPALSLAEAEPALVEIITNRKRKDVYDEWLKKQYLEADISVDGYYGRWEPSLQAVI